MAERTHCTVMLVGADCAGVSSVGCRLLGCLPYGNLRHCAGETSAGYRPFHTGGSPIRKDFYEAQGTWFGKGEAPVTVIDSPGTSLFHFFQ